MNGTDLRQYKLDDLRRQIALVSQDTYLFNDTLRSNILIARPDATEAELGAAVAHAALSDLVDVLPRRVGCDGRRARQPASPAGSDSGWRSPGPS